jgi:hypothetical protein
LDGVDGVEEGVAVCAIEADLFCRLDKELELVVDGVLGVVAAGGVGS